MGFFCFLGWKELNFNNKCLGEVGKVYWYVFLFYYVLNDKIIIGYW